MFTRRTQVNIRILFLSAMLLTEAAAQTLPSDPIKSFVGAWDVHPEAGRHMPHAPPFFRRVIIEQAGDGLRESLVDRVLLQDVPSVVASYTLDGREGSARISGIDVTTHARLEAGTLQITWRERENPRAPIIKRVFSVSSDGRTMKCEIYDSDAVESPVEVYVLKRSRAAPP